MDIKLSSDPTGADWTQIAEIFKKAPLGTREPEKLQRTAENSEHVCFAMDGNKFIGFARAISDGECQGAIYDLVVLPEYQSKGIGKMIMKELLQNLEPLNVILYAVPGKEGFYEKLGFKSMLTAMGKFSKSSDMVDKGYLRKSEEG